VGEEARKLHRDATALLDKIVQRRSLEARAVFGLFAANADGDDVVVYCDESRSEELGRIHGLRQQVEKSEAGPHLALSDFVAPVGSHTPDYVGAFAVTAGIGLEVLVAEYEKNQDDYGSIMVKALADRLAEALAEQLHQRVRKEYWGYAAGENLDNVSLIREKYQGIRPAPGYPACPDHTEKGLLFKLLNAEAATQIRLTDSYAMWPAAAVSGWYFAHPDSRYFGMGKISKDQVEDYARRKGWSLDEAEKWLSPNLGY
jgi:5-methyltetrahydrofolate--homocysteine methyltransferase